MTETMKHGNIQEFKKTYNFTVRGLSRYLGYSTTLITRWCNEKTSDKKIEEKYTRNLTEKISSKNTSRFTLTYDEEKKMTDPNVRGCTFKVTENKNGRSVLSAEKEGLWHQWGHTYEECDTQGMIQLSIGIVEGDDGQMYQPEVYNVKFHRPLKDDL